MSPGATLVLNAGSSNIDAAASWTDQVTGLPATAVPGENDTAIINVTATTGTGSVVLPNATITQTGGTLSGGALNWVSPGLVYNLEGGTLAASGNFNANGGSIFNISGGTLAITGNSDVIANGVGTTGMGYNLSGTGTITVANDFDLRLNSVNTFFAITADWAGSLVSGNDATEADWISELVFGAVAIGTGTNGTVPARQITVGGTTIDQNNFADFFMVTPDGSGGSSLALIAVPEPSSLALLALGGLAFARQRRR